MAASAQAAPPRLDFSGHFMRADGQLRCSLSPSRAQCVSMQTGRVVVLRADGRMTTRIAGRALLGGTVPADGVSLIAGGRAIACARQGPAMVCGVQSTATYFAMTDSALLTMHFGLERIRDDAPRTLPVARDYRRPVGAPLPGYRNPWFAVLPDAADPGGAYGSISPVTGLARIYPVGGYVSARGVHVPTFYRSCARCSAPALEAARDAPPDGAVAGRAAGPRYVF